MCNNYCGKPHGHTHTEHVMGEKSRNASSRNHRHNNSISSETYTQREIDMPFLRINGAQIDADQCPRHAQMGVNCEIVMVVPLAD